MLFPYAPFRLCARVSGKLAAEILGQPYYFLRDESYAHFHRKVFGINKAYRLLEGAGYPQ